jgi:hypothetical protein
MTKPLSSFFTNRHPETPREKGMATAAKNIAAAQEADLARVQDAKDIDGKRVGSKPDEAWLAPIQPRNDPWFGVKCEGAGKAKGKCGRQAQMFRASGTLGRGADEPEPLSIREQELRLRRRAERVYDGDVSPEYMMSAAYKGAHPVGPAELVSERRKVPVCLYHSNVAQFDTPHPDDRPEGWAAPVAEAPKPATYTLDDLNMAAGVTAASRDSNFLWLTDGEITVMASITQAVERFGLEWVKRMFYSR